MSKSKPAATLKPHNSHKILKSSSKMIDFTHLLEPNSPIISRDVEFEVKSPEEIFYSPFDPSPIKRKCDHDEITSPSKIRRTNIFEDDKENYYTPQKAPTPHLMTPSLPSRISIANEKAKNENHVSPKGIRITSATFLREFGKRIDEAISSKNNHDAHSNLFKKLRLKMFELSDRKAKFDNYEDIDIHTFKFTFGAISVTAHHKIHKSGLISHQVTGITSYENIAKQLKKWARKISDVDISQDIWKILHEDEVSRPTLEKDHQKYVSFLTKVCFLLFCTESSREPASLAVNAMFLDLVKEGKYKMSDIVTLPMSAEKAVAATRTLSKAVLGVIDPASPSNPDPKLNNPKVLTLLDNYEKILGDWCKLHSRKKTFRLKENIPKIAELVTSKINKWFGIEIKPFRYSASKNINDDTTSSENESGYDSEIFDYSEFRCVAEDDAELLGCSPLEEY